MCHPFATENPISLFLQAFFLRKHAHNSGTKPKRLSPEALELLMDYDWPGNVRQLENVLTRAAVLTPSTVLTREHTLACLEDSPAQHSPNLNIQSLDIMERTIS